eukprot:scaffold11877_cov54-Cylindrotheca_fusiformis.AAC.2
MIWRLFYYGPSSSQRAHTALTEFDVSGNRIASLDNIIISKHHQNGQKQQQPTSSSRLRPMNLEGNPIVNSTDPHEKNALAQILKVHHPELCCIGNNNNNRGKASKWLLLAGTLRLEHALDANYARVLLQQPGRWNMMPQEVCSMNLEGNPFVNSTDPREKMNYVALATTTTTTEERH